MTGTQQLHKTQGCSEREATLFSKYSKASKAGSLLKTGKLY